MLSNKNQIVFSFLIVASFILTGCRSTVNIYDYINKNVPFNLTIKSTDTTNGLNAPMQTSIAVNSDKYKKLLDWFYNNENGWQTTPTSYMANITVTQASFRLLYNKNGDNVTIGFSDKSNGPQQYSKTIRKGELDFLITGIDDIRSSLRQAKPGYGRSVNHTGLSKNFNFQSVIKRYQTDLTDSCIVSVTVSDKITNKTIYTVDFTTDFLLGDSSFMNNNVRSYITGENKDEEVYENDFGDIVVADFNFDKLEDFAVKREEGGNGGPLYNYYIQTLDTSFVLNKFLSDTMIWFPVYFNKSNRTLVTVVRADAFGNEETTYKLNTGTGNWAETQRRYIDYKK